ncbi:MAG TPA: DUF3309 family protein [Pyrinomonadaceae bacterium]|jgi:hypothetical protein
MATIMIMILIILLIGLAPGLPHSRDWGYFPINTLRIVLIVLIIWLMGFLE